MTDIMDKAQLAMIIHKGTTQTPGETPHECDWDTADLILYEFKMFLRSQEARKAEADSKLPKGLCRIWDMFLPNEPRKTGFGVFETGKAAQEFLDGLNNTKPGLSEGYAIRAEDEIKAQLRSI